MLSRSVSLLALGGLLALPSSAQLGPGSILRHQKISQTQGGIMPVLDINDQLGRSVTVVGDLDQNGVIDLASGGLGDDDGGLDRGAAYILFLRSDGKVLKHQKISQLAGGFTGELSDSDQFGRDMNGIGDLDGDGIPDLAVGANYDDDGGTNKGAIWILFLNRDGTVRAHQKISQTAGGFTGILRSNDEFGRAVMRLGDLDGDGTIEIATGAPLDSTGGTKRGAVWILSVRPDGTVAKHVKIAHRLGGFLGSLRNTDWFGFSLANIGDFDGDGVTDIAVGASLDDDGAVNAGAVWLLYLKPDGTVKDHRKISMLSGGFTGVLEFPDQFGTSVAAVGDLNGDGITELAVGAVKDDDGRPDAGSVYILFMNADGTVAFHQKLSSLEGGLPPRTLDSWDWYGSALAPLGDFNKDGFPDLAIGARNDDDGAANAGGFYLTFLKGGTSALTASLPDATGALAGPPGRGLDPEGLDWLALGAGPEPRGSLEFLRGEGSTLVFRLQVPEAIVDRGGVVHLYAATALSESPGFAARVGALLDPAALLGRLEETVAPGTRQVELTAEVPQAPRAGSLCFQGLWLAPGERMPTDAVEVRLAE